VKKRLLNLVFVILLIGVISNCSRTESKYNTSDSELLDSETQMSFSKLRKLFIVGDFDGDGKIDTLFQYNFSLLHNAEIDSVLNPYINDWDTTLDWFFKQEPNVYLAFNKKGKDTLTIGEARGLYCLLNIGDINSDGKDEIALTVNYLDFTNLNRCKIYSYCNNKWTILKVFNIHESAFEYTVDSIPIFSDIRGYLEKQKGRWVYMDFDDKMEGEEEMKPLTLDKCK